MCSKAKVFTLRTLTQQIICTLFHIPANTSTSLHRHQLLTSYLEAELLDASLRLPQVLLGLAVAALLAVELLLHGAHALLQLGDDLAARLDGVLLGLVHARLRASRVRASPLAGAKQIYLSNLSEVKSNF